MCDQALDLAETDEEIIDALLLKFDALLGKGDAKEAAAGHRARPGRALQEPQPRLPDRPRLLRDRRDRSRGGAHRGGGARGSRTTPRRTTTSASCATSGATRRAPPRRSCAAASSTSKSAPPRGRCRASCSARRSRRRWQRSIPMLGATCATRPSTSATCPGMELVADGVDPRALVLLDGLGTPDGPAPERDAHLRLPAQRRAPRGRNRSTRARDYLGVRARDHRDVPRGRLRRKKTSAS